MVNIEAARAICEMRNVTTAELFRPVAGACLCRCESRVPLTDSSATLPFFAKGYSQIRGYQDPQQARHDPACCRYRMQLGYGELDHGL